jgi:hypothetical protein
MSILTIERKEVEGLDSNNEYYNLHIPEVVGVAFDFMLFQSTGMAECT